MSQQAAEACFESNGSWLPLVEFSVRSGISASTIRRKIKNNTIKYRFENGRYLIFFESEKPVRSADPVRVEKTTVVPEAPKAPPEPVVRPAPKLFQKPETQAEQYALPFMDRAVKLVTDAYEATLKEKDERIRLLEGRNRELLDQLAELRTLVRALEEKYEVRY